MVMYEEPHHIKIADLKLLLSSHGEKNLPKAHKDLYARACELKLVNLDDPKYTPILDPNQPIPKERMYHPDSYFLMATTIQAQLAEWVSATCIYNSERVHTDHREKPELEVS